MESRYWDRRRIFVSRRMRMKLMKDNPYSVKNLLLAHKIMKEGIVKDTGSFRSENVGVYAGTELVHAGTPAKYVPDLMRQLFTWLKQSKYHLLICGSR